MKIALCIISKDDKDLKSLKNLVESAKPAVDSVHITVNHKPHTKIKSWCEKEGHDFTYLKWNDDFSEQRNYNFSRVSPDTDYIMWADTDDVIVNAHLIPDIAKIAKRKGHDCVFFTYYYSSEFDGEPSVDTFVQPELVHQRERLIRPNSCIWKKRIHETPVPLDGENFSYTKVSYSDKNPIVWLHLGADRDISSEKLQARLERNRKLLESELADEREKGKPDPRTLLYLMKILAEDSDENTLLRCIDMGDEYLSMSGWDQERALCYKLMATCMGKLNAHAKARDFLHNAIKEYPKDILLYLHLAKAYFNLQNYTAMKHWMDIGMGMNVDDDHTSMQNVVEMKILAAELSLKYYFKGERDIRKAYQAARLLNKLHPKKEHQENEDYLLEQKELDIACEGAHNIMKYYQNIRREEKIPEFVQGLPEDMKQLPFIQRFFNRYKTPRVWKSNEICYFANFGKEHFEKWDGESVQKGGVGGSETAVIRLAEEWTKKGYSVVVYGDPKEPKMVNGVLYLPFYAFNQRDKFNIFIQWRHNSLAGKISAKKYVVDLHDVVSGATYEHKVDKIDKIMVKSEYHKSLLGKAQDKALVISNGIS